MTELHMSEQITDYSDDELVKYVKSDGLNLRNVPESRRTTSICMAAVMQNVDALEFIKTSPLFTEKMLMAAINRNGCAIKYVDPDAVTEKMIIAAIKQNYKSIQYIDSCWINRSDFMYPIVKSKPLILQFIKKEDQYDELIFCAIKHDISALSYVIDQTFERCKKVIDVCYRALQYVNGSARTNKLLLYAVSRNGQALQYINGLEQTLEICENAINDDGLAIQYVAERFLTNELYKKAIRKNCLSYQFIKPADQTTELLYLAAKSHKLFTVININDLSPIDRLECVKINGEAIRYINMSDLTDELIYEAVKQDGSTLQYVPSDKVTYELCYLATQTYGRAMLYMPHKYIDYNMCLSAIAEDPTAIIFIPPKLQQYDELVIRAIIKDGILLQYIPEQRRTEKMCYEAVKSNGDSIKYVPQKIINNNSLNIDFYMVAVTTTGMSLFAIHHRTKELYIAAIKNNPYVITHVLDEFYNRKIQIDDFIEELCLLGLKYDQSNTVANNIPVRFWTEKITEEILKKCPKRVAQNINDLTATGRVSNTENLHRIFKNAVQHNLSVFDIINNSKLKRELWCYDIEYLAKLNNTDIDPTLDLALMNTNHNNQLVFHRSGESSESVICGVCGTGVQHALQNTTILQLGCKCNMYMCINCIEEWFKKTEHVLSCISCSQMIDMDKTLIHICLNN